MNPWCQIDIALDRSSTPVGSGLFRALNRALPDAPWFFMRKAPDVRLRVRAESLPEDLVVVLDGLVGEHIERWSTSIYEPQAMFFGGVQGMELAHAHFCADSRLWLELFTSGAEHPWTALSAQANDALFRRGLESLDEIWEVWGHLALMRGVSLRQPPTAPLALEVSRDHADALTSLVKTQHEVADALLRLVRSGDLLCGQRAWLANVAQFHFNRWGLADANALVVHMLHACNPMAHREALLQASRAS
jgi:thiopeptide-type bacteriocin biosynthesis protein